MFLDQQFCAQFFIKTCLVGYLFFLNGFICQGVSSEDITLYFPETKNDASTVRWANGDTILELREGGYNATMIETDVWFHPGYPVIANNNKFDVKIESWIGHLPQTKAGFKLNFKSSETIEPTLRILKQQTKLDRPVWFGADLVEGPGKPIEPVLGREFLKLCSKSFPNSTLSVGWTSSLDRNMAINESFYSWKMIWEMVNILQEEKINQPINFVFRSHFAYTSQSQMKFLLHFYDQSNILIRSDATEPVNVAELLEIRKNFNHSRILYNIAKIPHEEFLMKKDNSAYIYNPESDMTNKTLWNIVYRDTRTYITPKFAIINASDYRINSSLSYANTNNKTMMISGKISQFGSQNGSNIHIHFYNTHTRVFNCVLSDNQVSGCNNYSFTLRNTNFLNPCFIFDFEIKDMGKYALYRGNIKYNACHISIYNKWEWDDTIEKEISWELLSNFQDVRVGIVSDPADGYIVLEGLEISGEPGESWRPLPEHQNEHKNDATHFSISLVMFLIIFVIV